MLLTQMGADVLRIERPGDPVDGAPADLLAQGRARLTVDLKDEEGRELVLSLCESADALIEGFRPGVMERLGLGPKVVSERNPALLYCRVTGFGQHGPLASAPGHDINYLAVAGVLGAFARRGERPMFPLNLLADYGGGGMLLAFALVCGVLEARRSGAGQVVDVAMVDGVALLATFIHGMRAAGQWADEPGTNLLDSGAPFYDVYETADGRHVAVGAIEPQFFAELLRRLALPEAELPQWDVTRWPELRQRLAAAFRARTRDEWAQLLEGSDSCVSPVYGIAEALEHPHNVERDTFVRHGSGSRPGVAPRFSRTPGSVPDDRVELATREALARWGVDPDPLCARAGMEGG